MTKLPSSVCAVADRYHDAIDPMRALRHSLLRVHEVIREHPRCRYMLNAQREIIAGYQRLLRAGDYLAKAGLSIGTAPVDPRPERQGGVYWRMRQDELYRCAAAPDVCSALVWREKRGEHLYWEHDGIDARTDEELDRYFAAEEQAARDVLDWDTWDEEGDGQCG